MSKETMQKEEISGEGISRREFLHLLLGGAAATVATVSGVRVIGDLLSPKEAQAWEVRTQSKGPDLRAEAGELNIRGDMKIKNAEEKQLRIRQDMRKLLKGKTNWSDEKIERYIKRELGE
ncbi:MAG: hypothetical protein PHO48_00795 [Candidatus Gracilibacteria bacterium]|nr:hypothetical protein [Candidatus Gracilibacteria bacterium]MDD5179282.1 hypothetical protein [Candidatus Gracilibacteria bacterium]